MEIYSVGFNWEYLVKVEEMLVVKIPTKICLCLTQGGISCGHQLLRVISLHHPPEVH